MNDRNAFDRQLDREIDHLAGPEPRVDVSEVVGRATRPTSRWHFLSAPGGVRVASAVAVVAAFGGILLFSGILDPTQEPEHMPPVGSTPATSAGPAPSLAPSSTLEAELAPEELTYASGTFEELFASFLSQDVQGYTSTLAGPRWFDVQSSDPRLSGQATLLAIESSWGPSDAGTDEPVDAEPATRVREVRVYQGRMEIKNAGGAWSGTVGPHIWADTTAADGGFTRFGPTVLNGSGAYEGFTAYVQFPYDAPGPDGPPYFVWFSEGGTIDGPFEAVVVNRATPGFPSDEQWLQEMRRTGQTE